jgi:hypothetical protein
MSEEKKTKSAKEEEEEFQSREPVVKEWGGLPLYCCPFCAFDHLERITVVAHVDLAHPVPAPSTNPEALEGMLAIGLTAEDIITPEVPETIEETDEKSKKGDKS